LDERPRGLSHRTAALLADPFDILDQVNRCRYFLFLERRLVAFVIQHGQSAFQCRQAFLSG
jgi:hypothetical protein